MIGILLLAGGIIPVEYINFSIRFFFIFFFIFYILEFQNKNQKKF